MRVLVTGGAGKVGRPVVDELLRRGHEVAVCGRTPDRDVPGAGYFALDLTDAEATVRALAGFEAVVHLAALPYPRAGTSQEVFGINVQGTYNLYEACAAHGIRRLAAASSINALGMFYGCHPLTVRYFPLDEDHPQRLSDPYSFSKHVNEETARYFFEKDGINSVMLRIPAVIFPSAERAERYRHAREHHRERGWENYWVTCDCRDSARAFALGIEVDYTGAHTLFINDDHNILSLPARELIALKYDTVTQFRAPLAGDESLISCRRAKQVLGWSPEFSWRGVAAGGPLP